MECVSGKSAGVYRRIISGSPEYGVDPSLVNSSVHYFAGGHASLYGVVTIPNDQGLYFIYLVLPVTCGVHLDV